MSAATLNGMHWVTVRQHRRALWVAGAAVTLSLLSMAWLRYWDSLTVGTNQDNGFAVLRIAVDWAAAAIVFAPLLVGAFVAGPMVARELESGTYKLALTQSVTPTRWLASKLLVAGAVTVAGTLVLIGAFRLGWGGFTDAYEFPWYDPGVFVATGPVLVAYSLLALAVGALLGQLIRRTLVAMAATGVVTGVVLLVLGVVRWDWLAVRTATAPFTEGHDIAAAVPEDARQAGSGLLTDTGARLTGWFCSEPVADPTLCRTDVNVVSHYADYQPASHYWPLQLIETGIVLALAALALFAAFRVLRARHG